MKSFLVYKFSCASCSSSYIGKTCCHFKTRIEEHIKKENKSLVYLFFLGFFVFLFHILFSLSLMLIIDIFYCLHYTLLLLHLITTHLVSDLSLSSGAFIIYTLIIGIFYCLIYTSLLLRVFITHLAIDFIITM